jgi:hypothetical protein
MTHEQYLSDLISGFARAAPQRQPYYTGENEADAVLRWLAYTVALHIRDVCRFEPDGQGRTPIVFVERVWYRVEEDGRENSDLALGGLRNGQLTSHRVKVEEDKHQANEYWLRISDFTARKVVDVRAVGVSREGRVCVYDPVNSPHVWTMPRGFGRSGLPAGQGRPHSRLLAFPRCCQNSYRAVQRVFANNQALQFVLTVAPVFRKFSPTTDHGDILEFVQALKDADWRNLKNEAMRRASPLEREQVRSICGAEIQTHLTTERRLCEYWENVLRSFE